LLAGERQGLPLPGFDFGNSPAEFTASRLAARELVFTTSNGTRAILACASARCVMLAALTNLQAVVNRLVDEPQVVIACAGANDCESLEDLLVAGAIIERLRVLRGGSGTGEAKVAGDPRIERCADRGGAGIDSDAERARQLWLKHSRSPVELEAAFHASPGGRHLHEIGMQADIPLSLEIDRFDLVPIFAAATKCVTAGGE
jgi:2-phosphosulfolactate phosphatase